MAQSNSAHILLIDDDRSVHTSFEMSLLGTDHKLTSIFYPNDALEYANNPNGIEKPDIIFVDLMLLDILGTEVIKIMRETDYFDSTPVMLYTGYTYDEKQFGSLDALKVKEVVYKPCSRVKLLEYVNLELKQR